MFITLEQCEEKSSWSTRHVGSISTSLVMRNYNLPPMKTQCSLSNDE